MKKVILLVVFEQAIEGKCCRAIGHGKLCGKVAIAKFVHEDFSPHHAPGTFEHLRCILHITVLTPKMRDHLVFLDVPINESVV